MKILSERGRSFITFSSSSHRQRTNDQEVRSLNRRCRMHRAVPLNKSDLISILLTRRIRDRVCPLHRLRSILGPAFHLLRKDRFHDPRKKKRNFSAKSPCSCRLGPMNIISTCRNLAIPSPTISLPCVPGSHLPSRTSLRTVCTVTRYS